MCAYVYDSSLNKQTNLPSSSSVGGRPAGGEGGGSGSLEGPAFCSLHWGACALLRSLLPDPVER